MYDNQHPEESLQRDSMEEFKKAYHGTKVLVTGGLGFLGSNLCHTLVRLGAKVTIVDTMIPNLGGNIFNIEGIRDRVSLHITDIRSEHSMNYIVQDQEIIFHLAGQVNHVSSIRDPLQDMDINVRGTLILLESMRMHASHARLIFVGTRGQYGKSIKLPVDEEHPQHPKGIYALSNITAESMISIYNDVHHFQSVCLRLTNTYGSRHQMKHDEFGVFNWFIRKALDNESIPIFGDGLTVRDYLYVDDAVECLLQCGIHPDALGDIFNAGCGQPTSFLELAQLIIKIAGSGRVEFCPFTSERLALEPGNFYCDISKITTRLPWKPRTPLEDGIQKTLSFYRKFKEHYW